MSTATIVLFAGIGALVFLLGYITGRMPAAAAAAEHQEERREDAMLVDRLGKLLARTAAAMKGEEGPLQLHSYHDLPDFAATLLKMATDPGAPCIPLTRAEVESGMTRVRWAELLITQLPEHHEGRNSWLLNYRAEA